MIAGIYCHRSILVQFLENNHNVLSVEVASVRPSLAAVEIDSRISFVFSGNVISFPIKHQAARIFQVFKFVFFQIPGPHNKVGPCR